MNKKPSSAIVEIVEEEEIGPLTDDVLVTERPDGFYWQSAPAGKLYGPFASLAAARDDALYREDGDFDESASLQEAEDEFGASGWFDTGTGELTEDSSPHLCDEM